MTDLRAALRQAIETRTAAAAELEETRAALRRAEELVVSAEGALARHVDLDQRISSHRGGLVGAWARSGSAGAPAVELSAPLAAEAAERDQRLAVLSAARDGISHLARAEAGGITDLRRCEGAVALAAEAIVVGYLSEVERQWWSVRGEADRLADILMAGGAVWLAGNPGLPVRPLSTTPEHRSAVKYISEAAAGALAKTLAVPGRHPLTAKLQDWHLRLCRDADAALDPPPMAEVVPLGRKVA